MKSLWKQGLKARVNILISSLILWTIPTVATTYEDAEDNVTIGWVIYGNIDDATIENVEDVERESRVIKLTGDGKSTGYRLGNRAGRASYVGAWHNSRDKILQWSMKYNEPFRIYIPITTEHGNRFLTYTNQAEENKGKVRGGKVSYGLGEDSADGTWHTFTRDLEADWNAFMPDDPFVAVNGFFIKGSGYIDDVTALDSLNPPTDTTKPVITLIGDENVTLAVGETYTDAGATATDDVDGNITANIVTVNLVDTSVVGDYNVTYDVNDSSGNIANTKVRVVHVVSKCNMATAITKTQLIAKIANGEDVTQVNTCAITDMSHLFDISSPQSPYTTAQQSTVQFFHQDISAWDTSNVQNMSYMFYDNGMATTNMGTSWDVSNVRDMSYMFAYAGFDGDISKWDVSKVTNMSHMFEYSAFSSYSIGDWNVSSVTDMSYMFSSTYFDQPIGNWDVSSVRNMREMFSGYSLFNQDISSWDVSNVENMNGMFSLNQIFNQDIGSWNVSNVTDMGYMFASSIHFNQDISSWDISNVTNMDFMLLSSAMSVDNYSDLLISWSKLNVKYNVPFYSGMIHYRSDAQSARDILEKTYNWGIVDGGVQ